MTTSTTTPTISELALRSLAAATGQRSSGGFVLPGDVLDVWFAAIGSAGYPSLANTERFLDAVDAVSIRAKVSVDSLVRWAEANYDALRTMAVGA